MADKKVSELTAITNLTTDDLIMVVNDPAGTASSRKVTVGNLFGNVAVITKHSSNTTFTANTTFSGTTMAITANVTLDGTNIESKFSANSYLTANFTTNTAFQTYKTDQANQSNAANFTATSRMTAPTFFANSSVQTPALYVTDIQSNPATSNAVTEGLTAGQIFYSNTHLYVVTDSNTIKRVTLSTF